MTLVAGIDSSTQSCTVVVRDADDGSLVRRGQASHPPGTEVDPRAWEEALREAAAAAGGLDDVDAVSVGAQQHGYVSLDEGGDVVRPALLWNDNRSAPQAAALIAELGGQRAWAEAVGSVPVASFTATKARWVADHEPDNAARTAAVCLPHDWLGWRLLGAPGLDALTTDRGDASGTGWFDARSDTYRDDLVELALGHGAVLPRVLGPSESSGEAKGARAGGPRRRRHGGQHGRRARAAGRGGRRRPEHRYVGSRVWRRHRPEHRRDRHDRRVRGRDRALPAAGGHAQRGAGARRRRAAARCRPRSVLRPRADRAGGLRRAGAPALPRGRAHTGAARRDRFALRPHPRHDDSGPPGPGLRGRCAVRPRRRAGCPA